MKILRKAIIIFFISQFFIFADEVYNVQKGDTLYSISKKFQITVAELRTANNLSEKDVLKAGQKLVIPTADIGTAAALSGTASKTDTEKKIVKTTEYVVQKGDTLYRISKNNNISVADLLAMNNLSSNAVIKVGQKLKIPLAGTGNTSSQVITNATEPKKNENDDGVIIASDKTPDTRTYGTTTTDNSTSWPVKNPKVTSIKGKASGVQLSCKENETVTAVRAGTVMYTGLYRGYGQVLFIQSKTGLIYAYTGLSSVSVKKGDYVVFGDSIGTAGKDAINGTPQITFMVFQNGAALDPAKAPRG